MKVSAAGRQPAVGGDPGDQLVRRRAVGLQDEEAPEGLAVGVGELLEQLLLGGAGAARPGSHGEVGALALAMAQAPAGILAGEAGDDRIAGRDR